MSMHEMESLVECSVLVLADADPVPADARDLCYSLYELQDQFDCGYTVLRVSEKLERLGYLYPLPSHRLPEMERAQVAALNGQDGFIGDDRQIYFDADTGRACITAGSRLWEKLCRAGEFMGADAVPVRLMPALEVAQRIAQLARAKSSEAGVEALGYWYALFPAFLAMDCEQEDETLSPSVRALRDQLATPEALAFAAGWSLLPSPQKLDWQEACDSIERQWLEPYVAHITARQNDDALYAACQRIVEAIEASRFPQALELAAALPGDSERAYYLALTSLACHRLRAVSTGVGFTMPDGILSLEDAEKAFAGLLGQRPEQDHICNMNRFLCFVLQGNDRQGFQALADVFLPHLEQLEHEEDDWQRRFGAAAVAALFYRVLYESIPGHLPEKQRLLQTRAGNLPLPQEAERALHALAQERPAEAWTCCYYAGLCRMVQGDRDGAIKALRQADKLHPGEAEIQEALEQVMKIPEGATQ